MLRDGFGVDRWFCVVVSHEWWRQQLRCCGVMFVFFNEKLAR